MMALSIPNTREPSRTPVMPSRRPSRRVLAYLWAFPTTCVGLLAGVLALSTGGRVQLRRGVIEFHGGFWGWYFVRTGFAAMTLGHTIIGRNADCLDFARDHEHVHVRQVERWGPFFLPAYLASSLWAWMRGMRPYRDNVFEVEAYDEDERRRKAPSWRAGD